MATPEELYRLLDSSRIPPLLLLCGQEPFLIQQAVRAVRSAVLASEKDDFNDQQFHAKETTADQVLEAVLTLPVFAERKLVTVKDVHQMPAAEMERLSGYLDNPVAETCLLLVAEKIDNRRKFFQHFKKCGLIVEFKPLAEKSIPDYVRRSLDRLDIRISADALALFCSMVGPGLHEIHAELDKLISYIGEATLIDVKDVQAVVSRGRAENVFALGRAVGQGNAERALSLATGLCAGGEPPLLVLSLLVRHFRQLWKTRELQVQNYSAKDIARLAGVPIFALDGLLQQAKRFSRKDFVAIYGLFLEADLAMKSSGADAEALLESLVLKLVRRSWQ